MSTPGATISGFTPASPRRGPRLEKLASAPVLVEAPTVSADAAAPGEPTDSAVGPELPAATTNSAPVSAVNRSTAWLSGSLPSLASGDPRLMLTTRARLAAHSMPAMIQEVCPEPESSSTLPDSSVAPGATPRYFGPTPATVLATWVPWPLWSPTSGVVVKLTDSATRPARSGCVVSTPVSRTATATPVPSYPAFHASGAPISGTLTSSAAVTRRSSQIRST
jgi:hypothetical protein